MAFCSNCGKDIGSGGTPCDACGAKRASSTGPLLGGLILGVALSSFAVSVFSGDDAAPPASVATTPSALAQPVVTAPLAAPPAAASAPVVAPPAPVAAPEPILGKQWRYSVDEDPMSSSKTYFASVVSTNSVEFNFPYGGSQNGYLTLRTHPRHGKDVIFRIERGQILCPSYEGCTVLVRFDEEPATKYSANGAADNSTESLFLENYGRFAEKVLKSKRVRISAEIYQQGSPVFEFDVSGFDATKYRPE